MERTIQERHGAQEAVFVGEGDMVTRCRELDWGATSLGPVEGWAPTLRTVVRAILESPFAISLWSGPELVLIYNDAYRRVLGDKHPDALGQPGADVWTEIWPAIGPMFDDMRAGGPAVFAEDERFVMQRAGERDGEGANAWFTFALSPVRDDDGQIVAFFNVVSETTKRMQAEREAERLVRALEVERSRLEFVFRQAPAFLAVLRGPDYVFDLANDAYYQLVGHRPLVGRPVWEALPEVRDQGFEELLHRVVETGEPFVGREVPLQVQRTPGAALEERFVDLTYLPLIEPDGTRSGIIAHGTDVTEQVRARRDVERLLGESERARAEADAANRTKSEFLATMSHEFRTPLNAILGYAQLLDMGVLGPATPAQHAHLERLQASGRHLLQLVDDVLDVAKVDADRLDVRRDVLVTGSAISSAFALIQPQATAKGVRLFDLGADAPGVRYIGDEHRVRQILVNLLSNAIKFTPPGGEVRIACGSTTEPDPGALPGGGGVGGAGAGEGMSAEPAWAFVQIEDSGPGIPPQLIGRLFEPFVQGDSALTREQGGTGLGLAISRRLARLMGGDLTVRTQAGAGARFTLWLPSASREPTPVSSDRLSPEHQAGRTSTTMPAMVATGDARADALDAGAFAVLHAIGVRLAADAETVAERYVFALRADNRFPGSRDLPTVQLRNHATPVVGLLATQLMVIGETRGQAPELLGDGGQVQRLMDELHGAQRHRLGWSEADIERETPLLVAEVERALQAAVDTATVNRAALDAGVETTGGVDISAQAVKAATRYASDVARHVLERGMRTALRAYRFAKAAEVP